MGAFVRPPRANRDHPGRGSPCNPFCIPRDRYPHKTYPPPSHPFLSQSDPRPPEKSGRDSSARLPSEITHGIAVILSAPDVCAARRASRAFVAVFYDQHFWRARFGVRGERAWLFEAWRRAHKGKEIGWRGLYRRERDRKLCLQEHNRAPIWKILEDTRNVLSLKWSCPSPPRPGKGHAGNENMSGQHWLTMGGCILDVALAEAGTTASASGNRQSFFTAAQSREYPLPLWAWKT